MAKVKIRVPMIVTADAQWAVCGSHLTGDEADWSWLDEMCDDSNPTRSPQRYWIEAEVEQPIQDEKTTSATEVIPAA